MKLIVTNILLFVNSKVAVSSALIVEIFGSCQVSAYDIKIKVLCEIEWSTHSLKLQTFRCTHLATRDTATGNVLIDFPASKYSSGESSFLPQKPK